MVLSMPVEGCLSLCAGLLMDLRAWCHYPHQTPALVLVSSCLQNWVRPKDAQMLQQTQETFTLCCHILTVSRTTTTVTKTLGYSRKFVEPWSRSYSCNSTTRRLLEVQVAHCILVMRAPLQLSPTIHTSLCRTRLHAPHIAHYK
jgi:hypothetical protein